MTPQKEITINGQQVRMIYCAATENGFEEISRKSINVFFPTFGTDEEGNTIIKEVAPCTIGDWIALAMAAIVAAYTRDGENVPVSSEYLLYEATPQERSDLTMAIVELRNEWYGVPKVVEEQLKQEAEQPGANGGKAEQKNA